MSHYINLDDLVIAYSGHTPDDEFSQGVDFVLDKLYSMEKPNVKLVVRGYWKHIVLHNGYTLDEDMVCSLCGKPGLPAFSFCPHCGSDMREGG